MATTIITNTNDEHIPVTHESVPIKIHELAATYERIVTTIPVTNEHMVRILNTMGASKHLDTPLVFHYENPSAMPDIDHAVSLLKNELGDWYDKEYDDTLYLSHP